MRLKDRVSKLTKSHISFPDLLYGISSANNEPLYDVIEYLINTGFDTLSVFSIGSRCEMLPNEDSRKAIYFFLDSVRAAIPQDNLDWVITDSDSLDALTAEAEQNLMNLFSTGSLMYFKVSELLIFAPLDGFLEFLEPDTVSEEAISPQDNNSLASYMAEYTLPQVVALILHIDLADITTTPNNSYMHNQNDYDESVYHKFANLLQSYSVAALNNKLAGVDLHTRSVTPYKGDTETHVDLEKTSISRGDLDIYLASMGHKIDDLIVQQGLLHAQCPPDDSLPYSFQQQDSEQVLSLQEQVVELQEQLIAAKSVKNNSVIENKSTPINTGKYQKLLIGYPLFTVHQIACLLSNHNPMGQDCSNDEEYKLFREMTETAIDGRLLTVFNDKGQIPSEQVKVWLARRDFIYKGFNDDLVEYLDDEDNRLKTNSDEFANWIGVNNQTIDERDKEIEQLAADYEELRLEYEEVNRKNKELLENIEQYKQNNSEELTQHWEAESKKYKTKIEGLETQLKQSDGYQKEIHTSSNMLEFDWYNLDRAVYPPELHLACVIWQRIYQDNESLRLRLNSHNSRFEVIAGKLGLDPSSALGKRINTTTNPAAMKMGQYALAKQLYDIKTLNMPALLTKNPK